MHRVSLSRLPLSSLPIPGTAPWHLRATDPAQLSMTDFRDRPSVTVDAGMAIDAALEHMRHAGVRSAFVTDAAGSRVVGLITAYDLIGERPLRHMRLVGIARQDVAVRDLMTPVVDWQVTSMREVEESTMADLADLFERTGLTHLPVIERAADGSTAVRGLFSAAKVNRLLRAPGAAAATAAPLRLEA
ncbi:MAG: CBS domain-containing protein [Proteobacteria bacterium]|nr:CBS domain-containing protein [Pseudomonadota bacterium]